MKLLLGLLLITGVIYAKPIDSLYVQFSGDTVNIWNSAELNCCSHFKFETEVNGKQIKLIEVDTSGSLCRCMCRFNLCASLTGLEMGSYNVEVYRKYSYSYMDTLIYVGSVDFVYSKFLTAQIKVKSFQSKCLNEIQTEQVIYSNSFETELDTIGWQGYMDFLTDTPPGGGYRSVIISGGCIRPHAWYTLPPLENSGYYFVRCWGKKLLGGGDIAIYEMEEFNKQSRIFVSDSNWTIYESTETLYCQAGKSLTIELNSGGYIPGAMLIDNLEVVRVTHPMLTGTKIERTQTTGYDLLQNYPNPFNPTTKIRYSVPSNVKGERSNVQITIYDVLGNEITSLVNRQHSPGEYEIEFDGSQLSSGIYFYVLRTGNILLSKKLILMK